MPSPHIKLAIHFLSEEPEVAAHRLHTESPQAVCELLQTVPPPVAAEVLRLMLPTFSSSILPLLEQDFLSNVLSCLKLADIAAIIRVLKKSNQTKIVNMLPLARQAACRTLLGFPIHTVGAWLETDILTLDKEMLIAEALKAVKQSSYASTQHIFVLGKSQNIIGKISIYDLLRHAKNFSIAEIMKPKTPMLSGHMELEAALGSPAWRQADTLPVVNSKSALIGVVHHHRIRSAVTRNPEKKSETVLGDLLVAYGAVCAEFNSLLSPGDQR